MAPQHRARRHNYISPSKLSSMRERAVHNRKAGVAHKRNALQHADRADDERKVPARGPARSDGRWRAWLHGGWRAAGALGRTAE